MVGWPLASSLANELAVAYKLSMKYVFFLSLRLSHGRNLWQLQLSLAGPDADFGCPAARLASHH